MKFPSIVTLKISMPASPTGEPDGSQLRDFLESLVQKHGLQCVYVSATDAEQKEDESGDYTNGQFIAFATSTQFILAMGLRIDRDKDVQDALNENPDVKSACKGFYSMQEQAIAGDRAISKAIDKMSHLRGRNTPYCLPEMKILRDQYRTVAKEASRTIAAIRKAFMK